MILDKTALLSILSDWNFWKQEPKTGISRPLYLNQFEAHLQKNQIVVISGVRRSGKSYLMRQMAKRLIESGVPKENILIVNFEDPRLPERNTKLLEDIWSSYQQALSPSGEKYVFFDEVQEVKAWEKWVRMVHELGKAKIVVSGSNSRLLSSELATALTGRHVNVQVFPLSFAEYLDFTKDQKSLDPFAAYLATGGFPDVVLGNGGRELLQTYFEDIVAKDLVKRFMIRKEGQFRSLCRYYMSNPATKVSFTAVKNELEMATDTAIKFSHYLQVAYLNFFVRQFSWKTKEQEKAKQKVYAIDSGLAQAVGFFSGDNLGALAENCVFLELLRRGHEVFYWQDRSGKEVDFVFRGNKEIELIQVCLNVSRLETKEREVRSLSAALENFKLEKGLILTTGDPKTEKFMGKEIVFQPIFEWLTG